MLPLHNILIFIDDWVSMDCLQLPKQIKPLLIFAGLQTWCFVNDLKTVNNKKTRIDHETGSTHKHFRICTALAYNNQQDDNVVLMVNKVVNDTFDMAAAVATEFDTDATDDDSSILAVVMAETEQNTNKRQPEMNSQ